MKQANPMLERLQEVLPQIAANATPQGGHARPIPTLTAPCVELLKVDMSFKTHGRTVERKE